MPRVNDERRQHRRQDLLCPMVVELSGGDALGSTRTINISDGGVLIALPSDALPAPGTEVKVTFSVPRSTPNTYMLEQFACSGQVVRQDSFPDEELTGVALRFDHPIDLMLEV